MGKSDVNVWYGSPQDDRVLWYSPVPPWATTHVRHVLSQVPSARADVACVN